MRCALVIGATHFIIIAQSIPYVVSSLSELSLVTDGYEFDDYVPAQHHSNGPWILSAVSPFSSTDFVEKPFRSTINVDYSTLDTTANHRPNHVNSHFGSSFIPGIVDNSHQNSHPIRTQTMICIPNHSNNMKCIDAVSGPKPFNGYVRHTIRSGNVYMAQKADVSNKFKSLVKKKSYSNIYKIIFQFTGHSIQILPHNRHSHEILVRVTSTYRL